MGFEKYSGAQEKAKASNEKEKLLNVITNFCGYEVSVGIERGEEKISGKIDMAAKKAEVAISPEGIKAAYDFFKRPETQESIGNFFKGLDDILKEKFKKTEKGNKE